MQNTILVVDDEDINRRGFKRVLENYIFLEAANGADALHIMTSVTPDLIITDVRMPVMDGVTFAHRVRKMHPKLPIIFISGQADPNQISEMKTLGQRTFFKPINNKEILKQIGYLLVSPAAP